MIATTTTMMIIIIMLLLKLAVKKFTDFHVFRLTFNFNTNRILTK